MSNNSCKTERWTEVAGKPQSLEAGPKTVNVQAIGTVYDVKLRQDWTHTHPRIVGNRILSQDCTTQWREEAKTKLVEWEFTKDTIDSAAMDLYKEIQQKKDQLKDKKDPFNQASKIQSKSKYGTRYLTLPINVWCTVSDYVRYSFGDTEIKTNPEEPNPKEEWDNPKPGETNHLGAKLDVRGTCDNKDTSGGDCGSGAYEVERQRSTEPARKKDFKVEVSLKLPYTKYTAK